MKLEQFARKAVSLGATLKLDDMELLLSNTRTLSAEIERKDISLKLDQGIFTAGVRVMKGGRLGYVPLTEPDVGMLRKGIHAALAKAGPAPFKGFAPVPRAAKKLKLRDPKVAKLADNPNSVKEVCRDMIARAYATKRVENLEGGITVSTGERLVATMHSRSVAVAERTSFTAFIECDSRDFDYRASRRLPDLVGVAKLGADLARSIPKRKASPESEGVRGKVVPMIIHPMMLEGFLRNLVCEQIYASTVQAGMSKYRQGARVASDLVTLWDDTTAPWSGHTFPTDDEGTPARKTLVIRDGVLLTYLYDRASAVRDKVESTGNGRRRPVLIEEPHEAPVRCGANDLFMAPGRTPLASMMKGIKRGLLVKYLLGFHTANRTTGDFANTLFVGRVIRNGRFTAMPEPGRWSIKGNALDLLKNISAVSRETMDTGTGVLPWVKVDLTVA